MHNNTCWVQRKPLSLFFLTIIFLNSCQTNQTGTPIPTEKVFDLYYSPSLGYLRENISDCMSSLSTIVPYLHEQPTASSTLLPGDVLLTLGEVELEMDDYFVTQIEEEKIVFITNAANSLQNISKSELRDIFSGRETIWHSAPDDKDAITVWIYPQGSDLGDWLSKYFLVGDEKTYVSKLAPNPQAVLESVSQEVGAIGYLPESWIGFYDAQITDKIRILNLGDTAELRYSLPVLAYLTAEPEGGIRDLLFCLQEK